MTNFPLTEWPGRGTLFIFVKFKMKNMENFVAAIIVMMSLSVATFQVIRTYKYKELAERRNRLLAIVLYADSALVICDLLSGGDGMAMRLAVDAMLPLIPLMLLSSSTWTVSGCLNLVRSFIAGTVMLSMYHLLCAFSLADHMSPYIYGWTMVALLAAYTLLYLIGIWYRVREVRAVMQAGTVWAGLTFMVDSIYVVIVLIEALVLMMFGVQCGEAVYALSVLLAGTAAAYGVRIACDSLFVFYRRHERTIVESMKISPVEVAGTGPREDDIFKDIYERVLEYFEKEKPFLNGDLTINDIVAVVFTNKLYISRAISQHTGRNFCQFVNYHRVMYSVECFRKNPELKVAELWPMCGFNTIVSYNMAFRLFMGENPSDWCRKEKIRIFRKGK